MFALLESARSLVKAGVSVIPTNSSTKLPLFELLPIVDGKASWRPFQERLPTDEELVKWFGNGEASISFAAVGGAVSGGVTCLDFDLKNLPEAEREKLFSEYLDAVKIENPSLPAPAMQKTHGVGIHLIYRSALCEGNKVLARCSHSEILIETRGEGGYFLVAPSAGYELVNGSFESLPTLSESEARALIKTAKLFDRTLKKPCGEKPSGGTSPIWEVSPFDDYNSRNGSTAIIEMLASNGWTVAGTAGEKTFLKRPGSVNAYSATVGYVPDCLYVFSTNTEFEAEKVYDAAGVFTVVNHKGDYKASAETLVNAGYGKKKTGGVPPLDMNAIRAKVYIPRADNAPKETPPVLRFAERDVLTRGELATTVSGAGGGKSAVCRAVVAGVIANISGKEIDCLGWDVRTEAVLYIDSEQSRRHHHRWWRRTLTRAGCPLDSQPPSVRVENVRGLETLTERLAYLWDSLAATNCPELVIIDGLGDFVADINDNAECTALVYKLSSVASSCDRAILLTLHLNPGDVGGVSSGKPRGVLGSELWRKSETVLRLKRGEGESRDLRALTTEFALGKVRGDDDSATVWFRWDELTDDFLSCDAPAQRKGATVSKQEKFFLALDKSMSYSDLKDRIQNLGKAKRTAAYWIKEALSEGLLIKNGELYTPAGKQGNASISPPSASAVEVEEAGWDESLRRSLEAENV